MPPQAPTSPHKQPLLAIPFDGGFGTSAGQECASSGRYRFVRIAGRTGYNPLGLDSHATVETDLLQADTGTILLSICPLEDLSTASSVISFARKDPHVHEYPLICDGLPARDPSSSIFAWYWRSYWHPQMIAKFKTGPAAGMAADNAITPYVPVEHLPLRRGHWYRLALTWNRSEHRLCVYVNGILAGFTDLPFQLEMPGRQLHIGNPAMVFADVEFYGTDLPASVLESPPATENAEIDSELRSLFTVTEKPKLEWSAGPDWKPAYSASFCEDKDLDDWILQGCTTEPYKIRELRATPEGLLIQTPDEIAVETRMYLWSKKSFEGDLAVQVDIRPELGTGLALLVLQAAGMNREDFILDHPPRTTGSMGTIIGDRVRNYHWEFFRHCVDVRSDLGSQVLIKNPFQRPLGMAMLPPFDLGRWYRLLFLQEGSRLRASIDGVCVFDVHDDPSINMGPIFDKGRIGIRLMYQTRMRFANLHVWNRNPDLEVLDGPFKQ